jgi:hypothetical protein
VSDRRNRIHLSFPDDVWAALVREANRESLSFGAIIVAALREHLSARRVRAHQSNVSQVAPSPSRSTSRDPQKRPGLERECE